MGKKDPSVHSRHHDKLKKPPSNITSPQESMQNSKENFRLKLVMAIVLTILLVGGATYFIFREIQELRQEVQDLQSSGGDASNVENLTNEEISSDQECYETYTEDTIRFEYPCDWETNVTGENTMSAVGTVVAPDGRASFHYPAPDFGLDGMELMDESSVRINGADYSIKTYGGNGQTLIFIDMGNSLSEYGYDLMFAYESGEYEEDLYRILETFEF